MDKFNEIGFADWNKKSLDELVQHLERKFAFDSSGTAKAIFTLTEYYHKTKHLHKPVVGGPASASVSDGEQLGNEGRGTNAALGHCDNFYHNFDIEDFGECTECKCKDVRKSSEGHL